MRKVGTLALAGLLCIVFAACQRGGRTSAAAPPGDSNGSLSFGGLTRTYLLHLPPAYSDTKPLPLVLALHGGGGDGQGMEKLTHLNTVADQQGFIVVYPDGYQKYWADGRGATSADKAGIDDVGFLSRLIDTLVEQFAVDRSRVYVTGISDGGFMTERLACDLTQKIAAVAAVAATMSQWEADHCAPARPIPFMLIQGAADPIVPAQGGAVIGERGTVIPTSETLQKWTTFDSCTPPAQTGTEPPKVNDETQVSYERYLTCKDGTQVILYSIAGGGHTWPGGWQYLPAAVIGKTTRNMDASAVVWQFFTQFSDDQA